MEDLRRQSAVSEENPPRTLCSTLLSAAASLNNGGGHTGDVNPAFSSSIYRLNQHVGAQTPASLMMNFAGQPPNFAAPSALLSAAAVLGDMPSGGAPGGGSSNGGTPPSSSGTYPAHSSRPPAAASYGQSSPSQPPAGPASQHVVANGPYTGTAHALGGLKDSQAGPPMPQQQAFNQLLNGGGGAGYGSTDMKLAPRHDDNSQMGYLSLALGDSLGRSGEDMGRKRAKEDLSQLSSEDKLERTRLQNKTHSRRSRLRKKMYEEQLKSEIQVLGMYRDIVEEARDLISVHSMNMEAVFLYGNMAYDRVLGLPPQGLLNKALTSILHPDDALKLGKLLKEALLGNSYQLCTFRVQRANTDQWLEAHCSVTALPGRLLCIMKVGSAPQQEPASGSASSA